jgi:hypothetical protein
VRLGAVCEGKPVFRWEIKDATHQHGVRANEEFVHRGSECPTGGFPWIKKSKVPEAFVIDIRKTQRPDLSA